MSWRSRRERYGYGHGYGGFAPYVPVATRRANAARHALTLAKSEGRSPAPVKITGRAIATTFWGKAWCDNLEAYSDFANRLPRGRTYARNGSIIDLQIKKGKIEAIVSGSDIYTISISLNPLAKAAWRRLKDECSQSIASVIDLLRGRFDTGVMQRIVHPADGLFPRPQEIKMQCSCPDSAWLCKHLAAVLYGVGNRLDASPELLFTLRNVDHLELVSQAVDEGNLASALGSDNSDSLAGADLGAMFGIDLDSNGKTPRKTVRAKKSPTKPKKSAAPAKKRGSKATAKSKDLAVITAAAAAGESIAASAVPRRNPRRKAR